MLLLSWLRAFRARPVWFRSRKTSRRTRRRPLRRSVLRFHWLGRRPRKRLRLKGPKTQPMQSLEACEPRLMPGTLFGSAIDPLAGALNQLFQSDRDPGIAPSKATSNSTGNTGGPSRTPSLPAGAPESKGPPVMPPDAGVASPTAPTPQPSSLATFPRRSARRTILEKSSKQRLISDLPAPTTHRSTATTREAVVMAQAGRPLEEAVGLPIIRHRIPVRAAARRAGAGAGAARLSVPRQPKGAGQKVVPRNR